MEQQERTVYYDKDLDIEAYRFKGIMQKIPNHFHEDYVISCVENGSRRLFCKDQEHIIGSGDLLLFNPMDNHACEQIGNQGFDYREIFIKPEVMQKAMLEITGQEYLPHFSQPVGFRSEQIYQFHELYEAVTEEQPGFHKEETFLFLLDQLIKQYTQPLIQVKSQEINSEIEAVCDYIDSHYSDRITLDDLSRLSKMNKYSLLRIFTKVKGITPYRYLETVRINEAQKLLKRGAEPIDAAMQTGFTDQSHFTNYFKTYIGLTPKQYQNIFTNNLAADNE